MIKQLKDFKVENVTSVMQNGVQKVIDTDRDPVVLNVVYTSILDEKNEYLQPKVKIEISCMSMDEPFENYCCPIKLQTRYR